jgi:hypothetical protein
MTCLDDAHEHARPAIPAALRYFGGHAIALFPTLGEGCAIGTDTVRSFYIDERGAGHWGTPNAPHYMNHSRPATRTECAALLAELSRLGVRVRVLRRIPAALYHWNRPPCNS